MIILFFVLSPVTTESDQSIILDSKAPDFSLKDQYDNTFHLKQFEGQFLVLIASDKEGSAQNHLWGRKISKRYKDRITILGVADLRNVPFFMKGKIKRDFRKDEMSILLDWNGEVFNAYGLAKNVSNIILIDKKGYKRCIYSRNATKDAVERLFGEIDRIMTE